MALCDRFGRQQEGARGAEGSSHNSRRSYRAKPRRPACAPVTRLTTGAFGLAMKWLVIVLAFTVAQACDLPGAGPTLPAGGRWVTFATVPGEGPLVVREGIFAVASTAELETAAASLGYAPKQPCSTTCWRLYQADQPGRLYVAVAMGPAGR